MDNFRVDTHVAALEGNKEQIFAAQNLIDMRQITYRVDSVDIWAYWRTLE